MNEQELLERVVKAETQAKFLYEALKRITSLGGYDKAYYIADTACAGYKKSEK